MNRRDLSIIIVAAFIGAVFAYVTSNALFAPAKNRQQQVEVVQPITADFPSLDKHFFNKSSIDLTQNISIGQNTNPNPFSNAPTQ